MASPVNAVSHVVAGGAGPVPSEGRDSHPPSQAAAAIASARLEGTHEARLAVLDLERQLRSQARKRWLRRLGWLLVVVAIAGAVYGWRRYSAPAAKPRWITGKVERRDVVQQVQSTGTINPITQVQVGAQVSGRIVAVHVDFNSAVKQGQLLAEIDQQLYGAQVTQVSAQVQAASASAARSRAQLVNAEAQLERTRRMVEGKVAAQSELDQAIASRDVIKAELAAAQAQIGQLAAQLSSAKTTLGYAKIYSPIDGVVVNRAIDPGQTVAANFQAPVLFVIAQDLAKMQVLADIDEADVGKVKEQMLTQVVVDAFPGEVFKGFVSQLRYSPTTVSGVVTYSAVVQVNNPELRLRPGMTATVTIHTREAKSVLAVRNSALRFRPAKEAPKDGEKKDEKGPNLGPPEQDKSVSKGEGEGEADKLLPLTFGQGRVFLPGGGPVGEEKWLPQVLSIGITDGAWTELKGTELSEGAEVITEQRDPPKRRGFF